jgi:hypothetical protein
LQGLTGETGTQGATGTQGTTGLQGIQGVQGVQGVEGPNSDSGWLSSGITAASGWSIQAQNYRKINGIVSGNLSVTRTGSSITVPASGNIANTNLATLPSGYYNTEQSTGQVMTLAAGPIINGYVNAEGLIILSTSGGGASIGNGDTFSFSFWVTA